MSFHFSPVVRTLSDLAATIGARLQTKKLKKPSGLGYHWVSSIAGPHGYHIGIRLNSANQSLFPACGQPQKNADAARRSLAKRLSRTTFVLVDRKLQTETHLPLGRIRP